MAEANDKPRTEEARPDIERECELWDWVRTAGVCAEDLRRMLRAAVKAEVRKAA